MATNSLTVTLTTGHPLVTLVTMIAPSPDWFVGVSGLSLLDSGGAWLSSHEVDLHPWDAGTENGDGFSLSNPATSPRGVITSIRGTGKFSTERIAALAFTLESVNFAPTGAPFITGPPEVGEELTADTSGIADRNGLTSPGYAYRWVRVAAGGQAVDISGATSSTYTAQAADVGGRLKVRVSFTDDDDNTETLTGGATGEVIPAQVTVSFGAADYTAAEGGAAATVTVILDKDPHRRLTVPLTAAPGGGAVAADYAAPAEVVFNAGEMSREATVTASDDEVDDDGESVYLTFGDLPDGVSPGGPASAVVRLTDDDDAGVTLGKTALTVAENGSASYTVELDSEPTADVTVTITGHLGTDLTLTPMTAMLTFTPSAWKRTQTVTVDAGDDGDALNDSATLTHRAAGAAEYASVTASLGVAVTDDDAKATGAPAIAGKAEVGEELTANTSGIGDADGLSNVRYVHQWVRVASGGQETDISGATSAAYTVAVGDLGDAFKLRVTFTDDKGNPESLASGPTAMVIVAQVKVSFGAAAYGAAEGGAAAAVTVILDKDPHRTVTVPLTAAPGGGAVAADYTAPAEVVFNAGETSKEATVTAFDDSVDDDGESVELAFGALPDGVSGGATARAVVQITDNDGQGIVLSPASLTVPEGGGAASYTVALASQPTADVTVTITGHAGTDLTLTPTTAMLTFTTSGWSTEQSVTARASQDSDSDNDSATLTHAASGGGYAGVTAALAVTVTDDDAKATGAPIVAGSPEVGETLTADTSQIMDADGLGRPGYRYQWVRVAPGGAETEISQAASATYRVTADDVGAALKVKATFADDKGNPESAESALTAAVTVAQVVVSFGPGPYAAEEGRSVTVRVALDKDPRRTVTIPLAATPGGGADPGDYAALAEVVFNAGETSKGVVVTAVDDSVDDDGESVELAFGALPDGVSEGATTQAAVRITDNDGRGIDVSRTSLSVPEGGGATYTVALASQPTASVTRGDHGAPGDRRWPGPHTPLLHRVRLEHGADRHGERRAGPRREQRFGGADAHGEGRGLRGRRGGGRGDGARRRQPIPASAVIGRRQRRRRRRWRRRRRRWGSAVEQVGRVHGGLHDGPLDSGERARGRGGRGARRRPGPRGRRADLLPARGRRRVLRHRPRHRPAADESPPGLRGQGRLLGHRVGLRRQELIREGQRRAGRLDHGDHRHRERGRAGRGRSVVPPAPGRGRAHRHADGPRRRPRRRRLAVGALRRSGRLDRDRRGADGELHPGHRGPEQLSAGHCVL